MAALPALALSALLASAGSPEDAVAAALALPGARAELAGVRGATPRGCAPVAWSAPKPIGASGQAPLRFEGRDAAGAACEGWAWADVRVRVRGLRLARDVRAGEPLETAATAAEVEAAPGRPVLAALPPGATAARALRAGAALGEADVRVGPAPGDPVTVAVRSGGLELSLSGRAAACARPRGCAAALLPGGRRVTGRWDGDRILVEAP